MKRCPQCRRDYVDDSLIYCLDDGTHLLDGPGSSGLSQTIIMPHAVPRPNAETEMMHLVSGPGSLGSLNAIAVLPFVNMSADRDQDYFSDGLAEELLNVLSKIRGLRVAARTSAFAFKGTQATVGDIGRALNVNSVLEGSIRMAGNRIRISVQLVKVIDGYQIWSETYDRTMDDIFAVQDDIAESVVGELRAMLSGVPAADEPSDEVADEIAEAVKGRADDPEAQRLMMLGRYFLDRTTRDDTEKAIGYFRDALEVDPKYALCWAELGRAYSIEAGRAWIAVEDGFDRSRDAAKTALKLEPDLAEAHAQLGRVQLAHDWDFAGAEISYDRALELAPGSSPVLDGASVLEYKLGRFDKALDLGRRILKQDPLSAPFWHNHGLTCHSAGRLQEAEAAFRRSLELVPQRYVTSALLSLVLADQGLFKEAIAQAELEPDAFWRLWAFSIIHYLKGENETANEEIARLEGQFSRGNAYQIAEVRAMRGESDEAFKWIEAAYAERDAGVTHAKANPRFRNLHPDERWAGLLHKIGFES